MWIRACTTPRMSGTAAILRSLTSTAETQTASPELISRSKCFGGYVSRYRHYSESLNCTMGFAVYTPPSCVDNPARKRPVCILTCHLLTFYRFQVDFTVSFLYKFFGFILHLFQVLDHQ